MAITLSGDGISSDAIASLAASKLTGQVPDANAPSGSVIQVLTTVNNEVSSTTNTSWFDFLSLTITPSSTNSKILLIASVMISHPDNHQADYMFTDGSGNRIYPNPTNTVTNSNFSFSVRDGDSGYSSRQNTISFIHSPNSTSAQTYKIMVRNNNDTAYTVFLNRSINLNTTGFGHGSQGSSSLTAMEISA